MYLYIIQKQQTNEIMKTTTELFKAFTSNKKATITNAIDVTFPNARFYFISRKQALWLSNLIFQHASKIKGGSISDVKQYSETIDGKSYTLIMGKKTNKIRVF